MWSQGIKHVAIFTIFLFHHVRPYPVIEAPPIPEDKALLPGWFEANVKPGNTRKTSLDPELAAAEGGARVIKVGLDGSGEFKTITDALNSIPAGNTKRVILWIGPGEYKEKIKIDRSKKFVTLYGSPNAMPTLTFDGTAAKYGTVDSATLVTESDYFMAANIIIKVCIISVIKFDIYWSSCNVLCGSFVHRILHRHRTGKELELRRLH